MNKDLRIQPGAMLASPKLNDVFKRVDRYAILQCKLTFIIMCHYICQNIRGLITLRTSEIENDYYFFKMAPTATSTWLRNFSTCPIIKIVYQQKAYCWLNREIYRRHYSYSNSVKIRINFRVWTYIPLKAGIRSSTTTRVGLPARVSVTRPRGRSWGGGLASCASVSLVRFCGSNVYGSMPHTSFLTFSPSSHSRSMNHAFEQGRSRQF